MHRGCFIIGLLVAFSTFSQASSQNQEFSDFTTPLPLRPNDTLVLGIVGGWERWDAPQRGVRKTALELRDAKLPGLFVETVENHKLELASQLIARAWPGSAAQHARVILYGHSFGGFAAVRFTSELETKGIPVLLVVLVDAVGRNRPLPPNVRAAANFFQRGSWPVCGPRRIRAEEPSRTRIIGNFEWKYGRKKVDMHTEPWVRRFFVRDHEKMEFDPEMWSEVKRVIVEAVREPA